MAEIKVLKIGSDGDANEHDSAADQLTFSGYTADSTNGFAVTSGVTITDDIVFNAVTDEIAGIENQNLLSKVADETITGNYSFSGGDIVLPADATGTPAEGNVYWDGTNDILYVYNGSAWQDVGASGAASSVDVTYTAGTGGITAGDAVYISANDTVLKAQANSATTDKVVGFAPADITAAASGAVRVSGVVTALTGATAGDKYYLSAATAGDVTTTIPTGSGNAVVLVGFAKNATDLQLQIQRIGRRA